MKRRLLLASTLVLLGCKETSPLAADTSPPMSSAIVAPSIAAPSSVAPSDTSAGTWNFDADKADGPPAGFSFGRTGQGKEGRWVVLAAGDAPSRPNVLAQLDPDPTDTRFPVAVVDGSSFKDVKLSVSCKAISGSVDQGCGLVWRFKDANNYYLTRANALEDNVRFYRVKDGRRGQLASWGGKVASKQWHKLRVEAKGDRVEVYFEEKKIILANDSTFTDAGKVGLWTKADSVIQFDELAASAL